MKQRNGYLSLVHHPTSIGKQQDIVYQFGCVLKKDVYLYAIILEMIGRYQLSKTE